MNANDLNYIRHYKQSQLREHPIFTLKFVQLLLIRINLTLNVVNN